MSEESAAAEQHTKSSDSRTIAGQFYRGAAAAARGSDAATWLPASDAVTPAVFVLSPESAALMAATAIFGKAFLETLGQRAGDGVANIPKYVHDLVSERKHRKGKLEVLIGIDGDETATISITEDTPDEARLALLDLDVTADELRGKLLRWDSDTAAWRPEAGE